MTEYTICRTAADLIAELGKLPPETVLFTHEPPFTGVKLIPSTDAHAMIGSLWDTDEGREYRAARKAGKAA